MRIITLYQPYASLIAAGAKPSETRSWGTSYRGELLIHAAKKFGEGQKNDFYYAMARLEEAGVPLSGILSSPRATLGHVLALVRVVDVLGNAEPVHDLDRSFGTFGPGRFAWRLGDIRPLPRPIPWVGQMGLKDAPPELVAMVREQLGGSVGPTPPPPDDDPQRQLF